MLNHIYPNNHLNAWKSMGHGKLPACTACWNEPGAVCAFSGDSYRRLWIQIHDYTVKDRTGNIRYTKKNISRIRLRMFFTLLFTHSFPLWPNFNIYPHISSGTPRCWWGPCCRTLSCWPSSPWVLHWSSWPHFAGSPRETSVPKILRERATGMLKDDFGIE